MEPEPTPSTSIENTPANSRRSASQSSKTILTTSMATIERWTASGTRLALGQIPPDRGSCPPRAIPRRAWPGPTSVERGDRTEHQPAANSGSDAGRPIKRRDVLGPTTASAVRPTAISSQARGTRRAAAYTRNRIAATASGRRATAQSPHEHVEEMHVDRLVTMAGHRQRQAIAASAAAATITGAASTRSRSRAKSGSQPARSAPGNRARRWCGFLRRNETRRKAIAPDTQAGGHHHEKGPGIKRPSPRTAVAGNQAGPGPRRRHQRVKTSPASGQIQRAPIATADPPVRSGPGSAGSDRKPGQDQVRRRAIPGGSPVGRPNTASVTTTANRKPPTQITALGGGRRPWSRRRKAPSPETSSRQE